MKTVGVLISGRGTNLQALIDAARAGILGGDIAVVVSNRADAPGLDRARKAGIPAFFLDSRERSRADFDREVGAILEAHHVHVVALAGYMRLLSPELVSAFSGRIVNIHPSLLPSFPGLHAQQQAWEHGVRVSGATAHLVDERLDSGPILLQEAVPVLDDDTPELLADRILEVEHRLFPRAVRMLLEGQYRIEGRRAVSVATAAPPGNLDGTPISP